MQRLDGDGGGCMNVCIFMSDLAFIAERTTGWATSDWARSENGNQKNERMSVSDPGEKNERWADSEPRINERVPSSEYTVMQANERFEQEKAYCQLSVL
jgi:hypothetical protein